MTPTLMVSAILTNPRGAVLLQLRDDRPDLLYPNHWTVPGGHVEPGETPDQGIARELMEEMELALLLRYLGHFLARRGPEPGWLIDQHMYHGLLDRPAEEIPLHEGQQIRFFLPGEIAGLPVAFGFAETLAEFFTHEAGRGPGWL